MSTDQAPSTGTGEGWPPTSAADEPIPGWWIYRCVPEPHDGIDRLPDAPPWRTFFYDEHRDDVLDPPTATSGVTEPRSGRGLRAALYQAERQEVHLVNMALLLRRPLLVTGPPGVGKSTLAYSIARELRLGPVLRWPVTSRTTLQDGQYEYDAIGRLQDVGLRRHFGNGPGTTPPAQSETEELAEPPDIGRYLRLGPLGTALLPWRTPRVLLIDEIDKGDTDFPNDLLHVFEEGEFRIPELARLHEPTATVMTADDDAWVRLRRGEVRCHQFPVVVMTSNAEREFPAAFLRRCIRLEIRRPDSRKLARVLAAHLPLPGGPPPEVREHLIAEFLRKQDQEGATLAQDQLLNAAQLAEHLWEDIAERDLITDHALRPLNED